MQRRVEFRVVKEPYGWAVRLGDEMMTPFRSRRQAIDHANRFVQALRRQGEHAELRVEDGPPAEATGASPSPRVWLS